MEYYLLIARSVTQAQRMARLLEGCGIRAWMFRAPAALSNRGCSYAVRVRAQQWDAAHDCLRRSDLQPLGIYHGDGNRYREVSW
ncbi:MAG: DUF3343 domain-containing protein [Ruminococcaceae bacterium]|nr:DUF3343 domain-containing protein [Oscillospiraceae bacterium]